MAGHKLLPLHRVARRSFPRALQLAMQYLGRLDPVWIVADDPGGFLMVCQPAVYGPVTADYCEQEIRFIDHCNAHYFRYFTVKLGPGILNRGKELPCRKKELS